MFVTILSLFVMTRFIASFCANENKNEPIWAALTPIYLNGMRSKKISASKGKTTRQKWKRISFRGSTIPRNNFIISLLLTKLNFLQVISLVQFEWKICFHKFNSSVSSNFNISVHPLTKLEKFINFVIKLPESIKFRRRSRLAAENVRESYEKKKEKLTVSN